MMLAIAGKRGDQMARFHNSLYLGDSNARVSVLRDVGMGEFGIFPFQPSLCSLTDLESSLACRSSCLLRC
jgi:hypothetical protein